MKLKAERFDEPWPEHKAPANKPNTFTLGAINSGSCTRKYHTKCHGFRRTWYGPIATPWWPYNTFHDQPCECSCHNDLRHKPRLKTLIGPRYYKKDNWGDPGPEDFESR